MTDAPWYTDHTRLSALARWLIARDALPLDEVAYYLDKPWKWSGEYDIMCREQDRDMCEFVRLGKSECDKEAAETFEYENGRTARMCAEHNAECTHARNMREGNT